MPLVFQVAGGALAGFDTRLAEDTDACEIRFREMGTFDGVRFPSEIVDSPRRHRIRDLPRPATLKERK